MKHITIAVPDEELELATSLLEKLNWKKVDAESRARDNEKAFAALRAIAEEGGIPSIPDPSAWQREIRKDKPLHGREE